MTKPSRIMGVTLLTYLSSSSGFFRCPSRCHTKITLLGPASLRQQRLATFGRARLGFLNGGIAGHLLDAQEEVGGGLERRDAANWEDKEGRMPAPMLLMKMDGGRRRGLSKREGGVRRAQRKLGNLYKCVTGSAAKVMGLGSIFVRGVPSPPEGGACTPTTVPIGLGDLMSQSQLLVPEKEESLPRRVLILMSDTGGGHRASAQALKAAFDELYPGKIDVKIVDIWTDHAPWPFNKFVEAYQFMAKKPPLWKAFWEYGRFPPARFFTEVMTNLQCHKSFRRCIEESDPDLVISVHPLCQDLPMRVMKKMGGGKRDIPFVTVVTDLGGAHPTWFHPDIDACFVPSEPLARLARLCGLSEHQIRLHGLPIRPGFWSGLEGGEQAKGQLQRKLGLKPGVKTCLVVGGGDGVGRLAGIADSVGTRLGMGAEETQVVVVCGTNDKVKVSLEKRDWSSKVHMHVKGFVSNMDEWMGAVDCIVTKAGPGTIAEAAVRGLPIMLSTFLPGQEAGNVPYVTEGGFGAFSRNPEIIADTVSRWLVDDSLREEMSAKAKEASRPKATYNIVRDIGAMLFGQSAVLARTGQPVAV